MQVKKGEQIGLNVVLGSRICNENFKREKKLKVNEYFFMGAENYKKIKKITDPARAKLDIREKLGWV